MRLLGRLALCGLLLLQQASASRTPTVTERFEALYRSARTLRVQFLERYSENGKLVRAEAGTAYFRKPGKMRWEYEKPEKNLFLVDGKIAWFYTPADHIVTKVAARQSEDWRTPLMLLTGGMRLSRICSKVETTVASAPQYAGDTSLACQLRGGEPGGSVSSPSALPRVSFELSSRGELVRLVVKNPGSEETEFQFKNWEIDAPAPESLFQFIAPPGVVIVDGVLSGASTGRQ
jgi:outer membrane lipoprotein carrier protein